jgi:hypothetical protein
VRNDAQAQLSVQSQVLIEQIVEYPLLHRHPFAGLYRPLDHRFWMRPSPLDLQPNWFRYSVHLVLRDSASGVAAYEARAMHEGPWSDSDLLLPAVLDAALADYPNAVPTSHTVEVPVVRSSAFGR